MSRRWPTLPTESQELLLKAALFEDDRGLVAWQRWKQTNSLTETDEDSGRLFPLLCRRLLAAGIEDPDLRILKSSYRHQWIANQQRIAAAGRALSILADAGIETMVLKGAALAYRTYRDLGVRPMNDVDVLVAPDRAREAVQVLQADGWWPFLASPLDALLPVTHSTLYRDEPDTGVDLHWYSMWAPAREEDLWEAAEPFEIGRVPTLVPSAADHLLLVCVHGIWSHGRPLRWIADAMALIRSDPIDWDRLVVAAGARSLTAPLRIALRYLRDVFDAPVPRRVLSATESDRAGILERAGHRVWRSPPRSGASRISRSSDTAVCGCFPRGPRVSRTCRDTYGRGWP